MEAKTMVLQWADMSDGQCRQFRSAYLKFFEQDMALRLPESQREGSPVPDEEPKYSPNMCFLSDTNKSLQLGDPEARFPCRRAKEHFGPCDCSYGLGITEPSFEPTALDERANAVAHSVTECLREARYADDVVTRRALLTLKASCSEKRMPDAFTLFGLFFGLRIEEVSRMCAGRVRVPPGPTPRAALEQKVLEFKFQMNANLMAQSFFSLR